MGAEFVKDHGSVSSKASSNTLVAPITSIIPAGNTIVVRVVCDPSADSIDGLPTITLSKPAGETNSWQTYRCWRGTNAGVGVVVHTAWIKTSVAWSATDDPTITFSAAITAKGANLHEFTGVEGTPRAQGTSGNSSGGGPTASTNAGDPPRSGDLVLAIAGAESGTAPVGDSDTVNGSWSADVLIGTTGSSAASNVRASLQHKIVTADGGQTHNTTGPSGAYAASHIVTLSGGPPVLVPPGIPSAQAFGTPFLSYTQFIQPAGIPSAEAFGNANVARQQFVQPSGIASAQAFGTPKLFGMWEWWDGTQWVTTETYINHTDLDNILISDADFVNSSNYAWSISIKDQYGVPSLYPAENQFQFINDLNRLFPSSIPSQESFGTPTLQRIVRLTPTAIASAEAFGAPTVVPGAVALVVAGIPTGETFGVPTIYNWLIVAPAGIASGEAFGTPTLQRVVSLVPTGIASLEAFGAQAIKTAITLVATGIPTGQAFGAPSMVQFSYIAPTGIPSAEAFGLTYTNNVIRLVVTGIPTAEAFGAINIYRLTKIQPSGIISAQAFGNPAMVPGGVKLLPVGIVSAEAFGATVIQRPGEPWIVDGGLSLQGVTLAPAYYLELRSGDRGSLVLLPSGGLVLLKPEEDLMELVETGGRIVILKGGVG